ncbi:16S rRNA (cytosine(1402)-N(4))-methyltransferase RsmH [bacterium]|nr:16S rRNA (cytosine(1402)-N(4))-methyltransferase RsmH [bacterium]
MQHEDDGYHIPVLLERSIELLVGSPDGYTPKGDTPERRSPGRVYVDGTLGGGGHCSVLLRTLEQHDRVFAFDQDTDAIEHAQLLFKDDRRVTVVHSNVVHLSEVLDSHNVEEFDGILLDLGVSSHQIDTAQRGFSFRSSGPLDMRMDRESTVTAAEYISRCSEEELADTLFAYGEERNSRRIARAIVRERARKAITDTAQLADIVASVTPHAHRSKTMARIFQALRIAVNGELEVLEQTLDQAMERLRVGGRMVVISYHSLEDRIVKRFMRYEAADCICPPQSPICTCGKVSRMRIITSKHVEADENEIRRNPRARSARLRAAEKIHA